jgi:cell shape-determining protein MreD
LRRPGPIVLLFVAAIWLEQGVLPFLLPGQVSFRLATLLVIGLSFARGPTAGAAAGLALGAVLALLTGEPLGLASLALVVVGWTGGEAAARLHLSLWPARVGTVLCLLLIEAATTFLAAWAVFDVVYGFRLTNLLAATAVSPLVFWAAGPILRPEDTAS